MMHERPTHSGATPVVGLHLLVLVGVLAPAGPASGQAVPLLSLDPALVEARASGVFDGSATEWSLLGAVEEARSTQEMATHRRTATGFAAGATVSALTLSGLLGWSACTGSGDYLEFCRIIYLGGTALGAGVGGLVGYMIQRDGPPGRVRSVLWGTTMGALGVFSLSLLTCEQADDDNPSLICGRHGMPDLGNAASFALVGGLLAYALGDGGADSHASRVTFTPGPDGSTSLAFRVLVGP